MGILLFADCSQEEDFTAAPQDGITFDIRFDQPATRVVTDVTFNSAWEDNDQIGIFAVRHATGSSGTLANYDNYINDGMLTYNSGNWSGTMYYYPTGDNQLDFYAYYPRNSGNFNPNDITFRVQIDQNAGGNYNTSDLLLAKTADVARTASPVSLTFIHAMALIEVDVTGASTSADVYLLDIHGTTEVINWTASPLTVTATGDKINIKMLSVGNGKFRALLPAQTIGNGNQPFFVIDNGRSYLSDALTGDLKLTQGAVTKYSITLGPQP
jgi:hypothetical protein